MSNFDEISSDYTGFMPADNDGNAKVKKDFVRGEAGRGQKSNMKPAEGTEATEKPEDLNSMKVTEEQNLKNVEEEVKPENNGGASEEVKPHDDDKIKEAEKCEAIQPKESKRQKRKRGQNKNRPYFQERKTFEKTLCPSLSKKEGKCTYGEKCKFFHDIEAYMKTKPADIGPECVRFRQQGVCNFSFSCRYAGDHVKKLEGGEYVNVTRDDCTRVENKNCLSQVLKTALRKRKFTFTNTKSALDELPATQAKRRKAAEEKDAAAAEAMLDLVTTVECEEDKTTLCVADNDIAKPPSDISNSNGKPAAEVEEVVQIKSTVGAVTDCDLFPLRSCEKKTLDFRNKTYLAPLTTCGNLPFRVVCKRQGVDITCGEMAMDSCLLQGQSSEWALIKRHPIEDMFGVQLCGSFPDSMARCAELISKQCEVDFIDINCGCPIDLVFKKGCGSALMRRTNKLFDICTTMKRVLHDVPLTVKLRTGVETRKNNAHKLIPVLKDYGVDLVTIHGRSREARYTKAADWSYVDRCAKYAAPMPVFGNGDILTQGDYWSVMENSSVSGVMIARGALIKPWLFREIKERRDWDISSSERFDILREFTNEGLLHWGSDTKGVENTRKFLLEWLSFLYRYIPVGLLEQTPQRINERPPHYVGRDDLETLFASTDCADWVKISEMLLGKVPDSFKFLPKHRANSYS